MIYYKKTKRDEIYNIPLFVLSRIHSFVNKAIVVWVVYLCF